nr:TetR-like C-terminal domain-containing protein [Motilibacter aurantiacus]
MPSLYKHVQGLDDVRRRLAARAVAELAAELADAAAGRAGPDALAAVAGAYRAYAHRHPGRYPATLRAPSPDDPAHVAAGERAVGTLYAALRGYGLEGEDAVDATRSLRSALHGFVALEAAGGFGLPRDVDRSFERLVAALDAGLRAWPGRPAEVVRGR